MSLAMNCSADITTERPRRAISNRTRPSGKRWTASVANGGRSNYRDSRSSCSLSRPSTVVGRMQIHTETRACLVSPRAEAMRSAGCPSLKLRLRIAYRPNDAADDVLVERGPHLRDSWFDARVLVVSGTKRPATLPDPLLPRVPMSPSPIDPSFACSSAATSCAAQSASSRRLVRLRGVLRCRSDVVG